MDQTKINDVVNKQLVTILSAQTDTQTAATRITQQVNAFLKRSPQ